MNNLDLFSDHDVSKYREKGEDGRKGRCTVDDEKGNVVDFEAIGEISNSCSSVASMCNYYDFVSAIDEFGGELVDVTFNSSWLGKEVVADHSNVVGHDGR